MTEGLYSSIHIKVTILDTKTGERLQNDKWSAYWWAMGNGSCDCNRSIFMGHSEAGGGICKECKRYLIVKADSDEYSLREFNDDYPQDLVDKWL